MGLAQFIENNREAIVAEWVRFAHTCGPAAAAMSEVELRNHAQGLISALVDDMKSPQTSGERDRKSKGQGLAKHMGAVGRAHAAQRIESGFKLDHLVAEYRALRASVLHLYAQSRGTEIGDVSRFNEAIDEALTEATSRYTTMVDSTREQFLGILGHDLRNPLGAIVMSADRMLRSQTLSDKNSQIASRIRASGERMNRMIGDLLDLTRTRLGSGIPITAKPMDFSATCKQVIAEFESIHPETTLQFETKGDMHGAWDSDRIAQVVSNLVGNAIQHGAEAAPISIRAWRHQGTVILDVHNDGPAISDKAKLTIFDMMVQKPDEAMHAHSVGLGLGLYIARQIATAHGGEINVLSNKGSGTTFRLELPVAIHGAPNATH